MSENFKILIQSASLARSVPKPIKVPSLVVDIKGRIHSFFKKNWQLNYIVCRRDEYKG